ncbi:hypothetical protein RHGRI_018622 [Rhododendron griersonianum]|uniref:Uncharacterized protein n=1 Tax=Rhododendron griersonianum TaxID=479676 RepID=A0AAV6K2C3_9ERIC|nr:hypothetical protein RHGRI_018622 [Rhododendron griersonianum]
MDRQSLHQSIGKKLGLSSEVPTLLETESGQAIPSFVAIDDEKSILVGEAAKDHALAYPANGLFAIKTLLGRRFDDPQIQELKTKVPYKIIEGSQGEAWVEACSKKYSPTRILAYILEKLKELAESYCMRSISKAVIAVPVYFSIDQKKQIKRAGEIAGLNVLEIIDEPSAATLSCKNKDTGTFAVFSLGGGTFNITIVEISNGVLEVKAMEYDTSLGGDDFDLVLVKYLVEGIKITHSVDISGNRMAMWRLKDAAEKAKLELSSSDQTSIDVPYLSMEGDTVPIHAKSEFSRSEFEELARPLFWKIRELCLKCLDAADVSVDEVIMVGGMTKVPRIQKIVEEIFKKSPCMMQQPEAAVAIGALLQGFVVEDQWKWKKSDKFVPLSLGIESLGGVFTKVVDRGSEIPAMASRNVATSCDYYDGVCIRIFQGEHIKASMNRHLGDLKLTGLPYAPAGAIYIKLVFHVPSNGVLTVLAKTKDKALEWSTELKDIDEIGEDGVKMMANAAILQRRNVEESLIMHIRSRVEFSIEGIDKLLYTRRKEIPPGPLADYEGKLAELKKKMHIGNLLSLKSLLAEAAWLEEDLIRYRPRQLECMDSDDELYVD